MKLAARKDLAVSELSTRHADAGDLPAIARVHGAAFPGFFLTLLGPAFLRAYYAAVLDFDGGCLLVAEQNGRILGLVAGFVDPKRFYRKMARRKAKFFLPALGGAIRHPSILLRLAQRVWSVIGGRRGEEASDHGPASCELSSIAVHPEAGHHGVGKMLVSAFLEVARQRGAIHVYLTTDAQENDAINAFYRRAGFNLARCLDAAGGRPMNEYVFPLRRAA